MANRLKEEKRNERIIRGLLKLPENRRCMNCKSGSTVCLHQLLDVCMHDMQWNTRAKDLYLKEWDSQRNSLPDGSNVDRLRDFIKRVYVDGRFSGEKISDRPPRVNMGDKEDSFQGPPRSPPFEENYERRYSDRSSSGGRSPGYDQGRYRKSPAHPEIINDWRREDRFNSERKIDELRISDGESRVRGSPERPKDVLCRYIKPASIASI